MMNAGNICNAAVFVTSTFVLCILKFKVALTKTLLQFMTKNSVSGVLFLAYSESCNGERVSKRLLPTIETERK